MTYMKRPILLVLGIASIGLPLFAMTAADFSGSWIQDTAKSERVPEPLWLTRATPGGRGGGRAGGPGRGTPTEIVMTVQQDSNSLQVTESQGKVRKYTLDGKPSKVTTETEITQEAVTASLQGDTLVIGTARPYGGMPGNVTLQVKAVWSLSPDGKTLTITTTQSSPATEKSFKQIYYRK
jgi:hypothetical protein